MVVLSAAGGLDLLDMDVSADADTDVDIGLGGGLDDIDVGTHAGQSENGSRALYAKRRRWLPFFSLRFWTFGTCFFGLTGLLVNLAQPDLNPGTVALIAALMGLASGLGAAVAVRSLRSETVSSLIRPEEMAGCIGTVEIPFNADSRGKVRLSIKGSTLSFVAYTHEARAFQRGEAVLVVGLEHNRLWVVSADALESTPNSV
ncbi:hypothetical protein [Pseudanabaena sp. FACHB-2040]|uniref:hypothetical protein n=1 Tax=Pseudanabaena sp. FACHB-2040 TaxID=2692859 RepID=UPI0019CE0E02|nr:hypothetical protein [Pseudanabaena sp. FACHB-2040]MBD2256772.1 hypothetical protein [Pseudanabaena sp. FACHB-2040]